MTETLTYERLNSHHPSCAFPYEHLASTTEKSYYQFYRLKLRQFFTENRSRKGHEEKSPRQKNSMNHLQERTQYEDHGKRASSVLSTTRRRTKETNETRPKSILKSKQSSVSTKHQQRVTSAPSNNQRNLRKKTKMKIPTIEIEDTNEQLAKSNAYSYTQATSSSENQLIENHHYTRQSVMNDVMLHLYSYSPADLSKWNLYRDFDEKFSASISPRVYRDFERIIL